MEKEAKASMEVEAKLNDDGVAADEEVEASAAAVM